jgi:predicted RNA-binding protein with PUA-like domain
MSFYLLKTEPTVYGFADLQKEQSTIWDGVTNPVAVKNLRNMQKGDKLVIYHTGDAKTAVGTAAVESIDATDPKVPKVRIKAGKLISHPVTLAEIKTSDLFEDSPLVKQGRLSVVPLNKEQYEWITGRSGGCQGQRPAIQNPFLEPRRISFSCVWIVFGYCIPGSFQK